MNRARPANHKGNRLDILYGDIARVSLMAVIHDIRGQSRSCLTDSVENDTDQKRKLNSMLPTEVILYHYVTSIALMRTTGIVAGIGRGFEFSRESRPLRPRCSPHKRGRRT